MTSAQMWGPMRKNRTQSVAGVVRAVAALAALGLTLTGCHSSPAAGAPSTGSSATGTPSGDPGPAPSSSVDSTTIPGSTTAPPKASTPARPGAGTTGAGTTGSGAGAPGVAPAAPSGHVDLTDPRKKDIAMQLVSSAENSSLNWRAQFAYIEDIGDGRGYTGGIIGFCSGTGDMLEVVQAYANAKPGNVLAAYLPALKKVNNSDSHAGLDPNFPRDWRTAATDPAFQAAQEGERDRVYFNPAVQQAKQDGLYALGQFIYYDAIVMHGPGNDSSSFGGIRKAAMAKAKTPAQGGDQVTYLNAFLDARKAAMLTEEAHSDTSRVDTEQRLFVKAGNLDLTPPLSWKTYGDPYTISS